jgi:hypothetical protein
MQRSRRGSSPASGAEIDDPQRPRHGQRAAMLQLAERDPIFIASAIVKNIGARREITVRSVAGGHARWCSAAIDR